MLFSKRALLALFTLFALVAAACGGDAATETASAEPDAEESSDGETSEGAGDVRAAFVMVAPVGDAGWNFQHDLGRQGAGAATGVETAFVENIPEGSA